MFPGETREGPLRLFTFSMALRRYVGTLAATLGLFVRILAAQDVSGPIDPAALERLNKKSLGGYLATPLPVVEKMLELAQVRPGEVVYDLGSGDGRIVILAAQKFGARAVGIELDPRLCRLSRDKVRELGLAERVKIIENDILEENLSAAHVITIYMPATAMESLRPHLEKQFHNGLRIVVCDTEVRGWKPTTTTTALSDRNVEYKLNLYVISRSSSGVSFSKFGRTP